MRGLWGVPFSFGFKDKCGLTVARGDREGHIKEGVEKVGRNGQDGNADEDAKQDFSP